MVVQYLARQTRCPKLQRHTPDTTRFQSGQKEAFRPIGLFANEDDGTLLELEFGGCGEKPAQ